MTLIRFYSFGLMFEFDVLTVRGQTCGTQAFYDFELLLLLQLTGPPYIFELLNRPPSRRQQFQLFFYLPPIFWGMRPPSFACFVFVIGIQDSSNIFSSLFVFSYLFWQERVRLGGKLMTCFMIPDKGGDVRRNENDEREKQKGKRWRKVWVLVVRTRTFEGKGGKKLGWYGISWCPRRVLMMTIDRLLPTTHMTLILFSCVLNYS